MKKECSKEEGCIKAEAYCSVAERCKADVSAKLQQWGTPLEAVDDILLHLEKEKFVDERRYARAFVRDKYRFNQWGRIKIIQALRLKHIPSSFIEEALEEVDNEEYMAILTSLLERKRKTIKAACDYERNGKLIRFAAGHGYEMDDILSCLKKMGCGDESMD